MPGWSGRARTARGGRARPASPPRQAAPPRSRRLRAPRPLARPRRSPRWASSPAASKTTAIATARRAVHHHRDHRGDHTRCREQRRGNRPSVDQLEKHDGQDRSPEDHDELGLHHEPVVRLAQPRAAANRGGPQPPGDPEPRRHAPQPPAAPRPQRRQRATSPARVAKAQTPAATMTNATTMYPPDQSPALVRIAAAPIGSVSPPGVQRGEHARSRSSRAPRPRSATRPPPPRRVPRGTGRVRIPARGQDPRRGPYRRRRAQDVRRRRGRPGARFRAGRSRPSRTARGSAR